MNRFNALKSGAILVFTTLAGCVDTKPVEKVGHDVLNEFKTARRSAVELGSSAIEESEAWREFVKNTLKAGGNADQFVDRHLLSAIDATFKSIDLLSARFNGDIQFTLMYATELLIRELEAAVTVVQRIVTKPNLSPDEISKLFAEERRKIAVEPAINRFSPDTVRLEYIAPENPGLGVKPADQELRCFGFGFLHPDFLESIDVVIKTDDEEISVKDRVRVTGDSEFVIDESPWNTVPINNRSSLVLSWKGPKDSSKRILRRLPIRAYAEPKEPPTAVGIVWRSDGKFLACNPDVWYFGLPWTRLYLKDINNAISDVEFASPSERGEVNFAMLAQRGDTSLGDAKAGGVVLGFVFENDLIVGGRKIIEVKVNKNIVDRRIGHYEIRIDRIKAIGPTEDGGTDIVAKILVDGKITFECGPSPPLEAGSEHSAPPNRIRIDRDLTICMYDYDGVGPNDFPSPFPLVKSLADIIEDTKATTNADSNQSSSGIARYYGQVVDGGEFQVEFTLFPVLEE